MALSLTQVAAVLTQQTAIIGQVRAGQATASGDEEREKAIDLQLLGVREALKDAAIEIDPTAAGLLDAGEQASAGFSLQQIIAGLAVVSGTLTQARTLATSFPGVTYVPGAGDPLAPYSDLVRGAVGLLLRLAEDTRRAMYDPDRLPSGGSTGATIPDPGAGNMRLRMQFTAAARARLDATMPGGTKYRYRIGSPVNTFHFFDNNNAGYTSADLASLDLTFPASGQVTIELLTRDGDIVQEVAEARSVFWFVDETTPVVGLLVLDYAGGAWTFTETGCLE